MAGALGGREAGEKAEDIEILDVDQMNCKHCSKKSWFYSALTVLLKHFVSSEIFQTGKKYILPPTIDLGAYPEVGHHK